MGELYLLCNQHMFLISQGLSPIFQMHAVLSIVRHEQHPQTLSMRAICCVFFFPPYHNLPRFTHTRYMFCNKKIQCESGDLLWSRKTIAKWQLLYQNQFLNNKIFLSLYLRQEDNDKSWSKSFKILGWIHLLPQVINCWIIMLDAYLYCC